MNSKIDLKKIIVLAMFTALSFVITYVSHLIPPLFSATPFLTLDFKDAFVVMAAYLYGPLAGILVTVCEAFIEMITISKTGIIGFAMNVLSTSAFALVASIIYSKKKTVGVAVISLITGSVAMVTTMVLWNLLITPIYMEVPREAVIDLLIPGILPFNILKAILNSALSLLLYKRIIYVLSKSGLLPNHKSNSTGKTSAVVIIISGLIIITCIVIMLFLLNIL